MTRNKKNKCNLFIGHFAICLQKMDEIIGVDLVICENNKGQNAIKYAQKTGIKAIVVNNSKEIYNLTKDLSIGLCLVASFGTILNQNFINNCNKIINIHCGNLERCRGRHPLPTAINLGHKSMSITAHIIDSEQIDAGEKICEFSFAINYNKSYEYNMSIMYSVMPQMVDYIIKNYQNGSFTYGWNLKNSLYHKPLDNNLCAKILNSHCLKEFKQK